MLIIVKKPVFFYLILCLKSTIAFMNFKIWINSKVFELLLTEEVFRVKTLKKKRINKQQAIININKIYALKIII